MKEKTVIALLAAGAAHRMGRPKQLLPFRGYPLIVHLLKEALAVGTHSVRTILGAHTEAILPTLESYPTLIQLNLHWEAGLSTSIRLAASTLPHEIESVLFMQADQPLVTTQHLKGLIALAEKESAPITASLYDGRPGLPALFKKSVFPELSKLRGDQGARPIFEAYADKLSTLPFPDARWDLDTPQDYEELFDNPD